MKKDKIIIFVTFENLENILRRLSLKFPIFSQPTVKTRTFNVKLSDGKSLWEISFKIEKKQTVDFKKHLIELADIQPRMFTGYKVN